MVLPLLEVPPLLEVKDLSCRRGGRPVFERLSFGLGAGELLALTGRNGGRMGGVPVRALARARCPRAQE